MDTIEKKSQAGGDTRLQSPLPAGVSPTGMLWMGEKLEYTQ